MKQWGRAAAMTVALIGGMLMGCDESRNKISDLLSSNSRFINRDVTVAGEVTKVYELPLGITNLAAYRVNDGSGQIWVISRSGAPVVGDKVGLKGHLEHRASLNVPILGDVIDNVIEENQRRVR